MNSKFTPLDDRLKSLIRELSVIANDPRELASVDPRLTKFMADLFDEIEKVIRAERDKKSSATAIQILGYG
jgi:hypothetical protein